MQCINRWENFEVQIRLPDRKYCEDINLKKKWYATFLSVCWPKRKLPMRKSREVAEVDFCWTAGRVLEGNSTFCTRIQPPRSSNQLKDNGSQTVDIGDFGHHDRLRMKELHPTIIIDLSQQRSVRLTAISISLRISPLGCHLSANREIGARYRTQQTEIGLKENIVTRYGALNLWMFTPPALTGNT